MKTYRAKSGFIKRNIAGCDVLIPIGNNVANFNGFIELNSTASFIWDKLADGISKEKLLDEMCLSFEEISKDEAASDINEFFSILVDNKMIEEIK